MDYQQIFYNVLLSKPHVILGKKGITEDLINHIKKLVKVYKVIKIKALKTIVKKQNIKELANIISEKTETYLLDVRGFTFIISKFQIKK